MRPRDEQSREQHTRPLHALLPHDVTQAEAIATLRQKPPTNFRRKSTIDPVMPLFEQYLDIAAKCIS